MKIFITHRLLGAAWENARRRRLLPVLVTPLPLPFTLLADSVILTLLGAPLLLTWLFQDTDSEKW